MNDSAAFKTWRKVTPLIMTCYLLFLTAMGVFGAGSAAFGDEIVRQWAESALASSQFGAEKWGAIQATGAPDTPTEGDHDTAWATHEADEGIQWLELCYAAAVYAESVRIRETFNPGAVAKVELRDLAGTYHNVWEGNDLTKSAPSFLELRFERTPHLVQGVRIYLDSDRVKGWNEIDAVELVGSRTPPPTDGFQATEELRQWAVGATSGSAYPTESWSPKQATGKPDTFRNGDSITAWTPERKEMGLVWLELTYEKEVQPTLVRIRETFNPGAVAKIEFKDPAGNYHLGWEGVDSNNESPGHFEAPITYAPYLAKVVRIWVDTDRVRGWNEIDAVELVGSLGVHEAMVELHQWASGASASSEYGPVDGSAREATGPPDTLAAGDHPTAWAAQFPDKGTEWLELRYGVPVHATGLRILETCNPGAIVEIELRDPLGNHHSVWKGSDPVKKPPGWFERNFERTEYEVNAVRIHLDGTHSKGWEEIDAAELIGLCPSLGPKGSQPPAMPIAQWAVRAVASSEFGSPNWGAGMATGLPDTVENGDFGSAWAPKLEDAGVEWLQLSYAKPVYAIGVRVRETFNPGAISKLSFLDAAGGEHVVWEGISMNGNSPGYFELVFPRTDYPTVGVKVFLDTARVAGFNEIDAVELIGYE